MGDDIQHRPGRRVRLVYLVSLITAGVLLIAQSLVLGATTFTHPDGHPAAFAGYESAMPGQTMNLPSTTDGVTCHDQYLSYREGLTYCLVALLPEDRYFTSATALVYQNRVIRTDFESKDLHVIDVIAQWGYPTVIEERADTIQLLWEDQGLYAIIDPVGAVIEYSVQLPIETFMVGIMSMNPPF